MHENVCTKCKATFKMKRDSDVDVSKTKSMMMATTYHGPSIIVSKQRDKFMDELFSYANNAISHDFPLCLDCIHSLILEYEKEYKELNDFSNTEFIHEFIRKDPLVIESETPINDDDIRKMEQDFKREKLELELKQDTYFNEYNTYSILHYDLECQKKSILDKLENTKRDSLMLNSTFLLNEVFHIWFDGFFGCINNFRVGRLSSQPVEWNEINAGLGYMVLLLDVLATKLGVKFTKYQLIPFGSFSCISSGNQKLEFFGGNGGYFWSLKFDKAMSGFYACLSEVVEKLPNIALPYEMKEERINQIPFKYSNIDQDKWTRVMKYCLTNMKWILVYLAK
jgi:beclin 1